MALEMPSAFLDVIKQCELVHNIANTIVVSGVNVDLKDGDVIMDSCSTSEGAVEFKFTVNPGTYTLTVSAPGYATEEQQVEVKSGETFDVGDICLELESK